MITAKEVRAMVGVSGEKVEVVRLTGGENSFPATDKSSSAVTAMKQGLLQVSLGAMRGGKHG